MLRKDGAQFLLLANLGSAHAASVLYAAIIKRPPARVADRMKGRSVDLVCANRRQGNGFHAKGQAKTPRRGDRHADAGVRSWAYSNHNSLRARTRGQSLVQRHKQLPARLRPGAK